MGSLAEENRVELARWPHQTFGVAEVLRLRAEGARRICVTSPTGGGKSLIIRDLIAQAVQNNEQSVLYTNRKLLVEQLSNTLDAGDIDHGIRAADYDDQREKPVQISSLPTEISRVYNRKKDPWKLHPADWVFVDEAHLHKEKTARRIFADHLARPNTTIVGITATPLALGDVYDELVVAGNNSELRACGALVPAWLYGPDEPDTRFIGKKLVEYSEDDVRKAIMTTHIFARVFDWYKRLNPDRRPALLFAPGVQESVYFAEQFAAEGVRAAHIDGEECWVDGQWYKTSKQVRADILGGSQDGKIQVVCNRFVLREGVDMPWVYHGIFATIFSTLQAFLQSGGRILRQHYVDGVPQLDRVIVQDHGGNWWRHGSLNASREWDLWMDDAKVQALREENLRAKSEVEPARCPKCALTLVQGKCMGCGFTFDMGKRSRPVIQQDGTLKELEGAIFRERPIRRLPDTSAKWKACYFRMKNAGMTFRQAEALFFREQGYYPPRDLPYMPVRTIDWFQRVKDVPANMLLWPDPAQSARGDGKKLF